MNTFVKLIVALIVVTIITACDGGRYEGLKLWEPGSPDHGQICGINDWKTGEVLPVESVQDDTWDHADWSWVPREGCPQ